MKKLNLFVAVLLALGASLARADDDKRGKNHRQSGDRPPRRQEKGHESRRTPYPSGQEPENRGAQYQEAPGRGHIEDPAHRYHLVGIITEVGNGVTLLRR